MKIEARFIVAALFSATAFALTGGVRATEQAVAAEEGKPPAVETSIPFVNMGGIRDWKAIDNETLYVQDQGRNWYIARLSVPSPDLPFATRIGFETRGVNQLDKFGAVVVAGQRYPLISFVASGAPPAPAKK